MSNKLLVDTNILIYANLPNEHFHTKAKSKLEDLSSQYDLVISRQIIREYLKVKSTIMQQNNLYDTKILVADANFLIENFIVLDEENKTTESLLHFIEAYQVKGKQIHDCNIAASIVQHQVFSIFTNNAKDFKRYEPLIHIISLFDDEIEHSMHIIGLNP